MVTSAGPKVGVLFLWPVAFVQSLSAAAWYPFRMNATGPFDVKMNFTPPFAAHEGVELSRATGDKRFTGVLEAESQVHMLAVKTPVEGSAAYVAVEQIVGTLDGRAGSFAVTHVASMGAAGPQMSLSIVPDSGTGELTGITGSMAIRIVDKQHHYDIDWNLPG